eukprot:142129-Alexandrium_andersonii.AAC.1
MLQRLCYPMGPQRAKCESLPLEGGWGGGPGEEPPLSAHAGNGCVQPASSGQGPCPAEDRARPPGSGERRRAACRGGRQPGTEAVQR